MIKGSLRSLLIGAAVSAGLVASAGAAHAVQYNFGDVEVHLDTTVSAGASARTAQTDHSLLPTSNGGPLQATNPAGSGCNLAGVPGTTTGANCDVVVPAVLPINNTVTTYGINAYGNGDKTSLSGSINTDDGRLNFKQWDITSGVVKMTNDISASWQNYKFFGRVSSYYDAVLNSSGSYRRSDLVDGQADAARDVKLLDFYGSGDYNIGDLPLNVRAGKQVISWGESTFIQNGVNTFNPVDVSAVRRPGAELKEFFIPVWAADASIGLPYNLSVEAFYQLKWDTYALDRPGTPFASADSVASGSGVGGNFNAVSFLTGGPGGNILRNCSSPNPVSTALTTAYAGAGTPYASMRDCSSLYSSVGVGGTLDYTTYNNVTGGGGWPIGNTEALRLAYNDTSIIARDEDRYAKNSGQWGLAARWYSEDLNNTEFGLYFTNTHSRLPFASERVRQTGNTQYSSYLLDGSTSSTTSRALGYAGCNIANGGAAGTTAPNALYGVPLGVSVAALNQMNQTPASGYDPSGVFGAAETLANNYYANSGGTYLVNPSPAAGAGIFSAGIAGTDISGFTGMTSNGGKVAAGSILEETIINCALLANQTTIAGGNRLAVDGTEVLLASEPTPALGLFLEYPENIHMIGASFNTTVGTWGVQGETSFRPNAPVQLDTDQITIDALNKGCVFEQLLGASAYQGLIPAILGNPNPDTLGGACGDLGTSPTSQDVHGFRRTRMWTAQVGTTATYTNSNSVVEATGADLGILVTEVGATYFPDAPDAPNMNLPTGTGGPTTSGGTRWGNVCTTGTDLPLAGFLALASRQGCRPTTMSWGYVILGQLQYNNAFGTAVTLSPSIAFSHDVSGNTPAPYSNYRQGRKSINLSLNGSFQDAWKAGISYTNFFGADKYNDAIDRDYAAVNISYAF